MRRFGHSSANVPAIGQGTWQMEGDDRASAVQSLKLGIELGLTHVDTAEMYGSGRVEEIVAEAIAGQRERVFLASKVLPDNASRKGTIRACENTLKRLNTDHLDCYLLHWPGRHPLSDTIAAFRSSRARERSAPGASATSTRRSSIRTLSIAGPGRISCNQVLYHLGERSIEHAVLPWCEANGVTLVGYTPFGRAKFPPSGSGGDALARIAKARGKTVRQVALAFLTRKPNLFAIPKASKPEHVRDNAGALGLELLPEEIDAIDAGFPLSKKRRGVPML